MIQSFIECRPEINVGMLCGQLATGASGSVHAYLPRRSLESRPRRGVRQLPRVDPLVRPVWTPRLGGCVATVGKLWI